MASPVTPATQITIKLVYGAENRRVKLALKDLGANTLPEKLRGFLAIPSDKNVSFERYSDSAGAYVQLDKANTAVYKQLYRAAKAKLKLRIKVVVTDTEIETASLVGPATERPLAANDLDLAGLHLEEPEPKAARQPTAQKSEATLLEEWLRQKKTSVAAHEAAAEEAPVPRPFSERTCPWASALPKDVISSTLPFMPFSVCCNRCQASIPDYHWHCSTCDEGDFDLCKDCLNKGLHCDVDHHYLLKRTIQDGKFINSTNETVAKREKSMTPSKAEAEAQNEVPGAFTSQTKENLVPVDTIEQKTRTCNICINALYEVEFVHCQQCVDYDICFDCLISGDHGHNPAHAFKAVALGENGSERIVSLCQPGRGVSHFAICDGCDKALTGVRHKCLDCPDWDYCSECIQSAHFIHPTHRFAPIYESIPMFHNSRPAVHDGIRCDGPLCTSKPQRGLWIEGDRYKCAVCHDTDFCANCEALPTNEHNRTHPLIKFRSPVRNVSVSTFDSDERSNMVTALGDRMVAQSSRSTETVPSAPCANAWTQWQSATEPMVKEEPKQEIEHEESLHDHILAEEEIKRELGLDDLIVNDEEQHVEEPTVALPPPSPTSPRARKPQTAPKLEAIYVDDSVADGSRIYAGTTITQSWTLANPGPLAWPRGSRLHYVGGDNMLNIDKQNMGSVKAIELASTSNWTAIETPSGGEYTFTVVLKAPGRAGRAVSYWRLHSPEGKAFGHRLWCDVEIVEDPVPAYETLETAPAATFEESAAPEKAQAESQMIFPQLEKESPSSSQHASELESCDKSNASLPTTAAKQKEVIPASPSVMVSEGHDGEIIVDEIDSLSIEEDETTDDGFLTDEEYEILDEDYEEITGKN